MTAMGCLARSHLDSRGVDAGARWRDLAARHSTVHLSWPDFRGIVARTDSEEPNEGAKQQP